MLISNAYLAHVLCLLAPKRDADAGRRLKDEQSRVELFLSWLALYAKPISASLLDDYREYLQAERSLTASSVRAYLSSARSWLRNLLLNGVLR